jgi:hypothetical protein
MGKYFEDSGFLRDYVHDVEVDDWDLGRIV